jgi:hypothetical protein
MKAILTAEQRQSYREQGYLVVSGLIPERVARDAETTMWRLLELDPEDRTGWPRSEIEHRTYRDPALLACFTGVLLGAAAELGGDDPTSYRPPSAAYAINIFPQEGEWRWPAPHIDHARKEHGQLVFPRPFRVACMLYLTDTPPHGAGTVVWPGSHARLEELAKSDRQRYELMWALGCDLGRVELGPPKELAPRQGDAVFYHYLCAHSGSMNTSDRPRFALNMKW